MLYHRFKRGCSVKVLGNVSTLQMCSQPEPESQQLVMHRLSVNNKPIQSAIKTPLITPQTHRTSHWVQARTYTQ